MHEFTDENRAAMDQLLEDRRAGFKQGGNRLYKHINASEERKAELSQAIRVKSALLVKGAGIGAVNFNDEDDVRTRTLEYLESCARTGSFPSLSGLAVYGLGVCRDTLYKRFYNYPDHPTTRFLGLVRDMIGDVMSDAALQRRADPVSVIFQLKNGYGFADRVEIEPVTPRDNSETAYDAEELRKIYGDSSDGESSLPEPPEDD